MRFLALSLYLFTASVASAAQSCEMSSIGACANTNALVWAKSFKPALLTFLDKRKVAWLGERQAVARVTQEVLGGAPDDVAKVADGVLRFSAVRAQSALERGGDFHYRHGNDKGDRRAAFQLRHDVREVLLAFHHRPP